MTRPDFELPVRRAAQIDKALAAGLTLEQLDVLIAARNQLHAGQPVWIGLGDGADVYADRAAGDRLLSDALANPAAMEWDAVAVTAIRRQLRPR